MNYKQTREFADLTRIPHGINGQTHMGQNFTS